MGSLLRFPLSRAFVEHFPLFIETGTGAGISLRYAACHNFRRLWSIDCWQPHYIAAYEEFKDDRRVMPMFGKSSEGLDFLLSRDETSGPIFFFLDAHLPGCDFGGQAANLESNFDIRFPLEQELEVIRAKRPDGNYCLLIDDLRFYADGMWGDGDIDGEIRRSALEALRIRGKSLSFLDPFRRSHSLEIEYRDAGYAIVRPFGAPSLTFSEREL